MAVLGLHQQRSPGMSSLNVKNAILISVSPGYFVDTNAFCKDTGFPWTAADGKKNAMLAAVKFSSASVGSVWVVRVKTTVQTI